MNQPIPTPWKNNQNALVPYSSVQNLPVNPDISAQVYADQQKNQKIIALQARLNQMIATNQQNYPPAQCGQPRTRIAYQRQNYPIQYSSNPAQPQTMNVYSGNFVTYNIVNEPTAPRPIPRAPGQSMNVYSGNFITKNVYNVNPPPMMNTFNVNCQR